MDRLGHKKIELNNAISAIKQASSAVKQLTKEVKKGVVSPKELEHAIENLKRKGGELKIIHAEAKILSGYDRVTFSDIAPSSYNKTPLWAILGLIALTYIVFG